VTCMPPMTSPPAPNEQEAMWVSNHSVVWIIMYKMYWRYMFTHTLFSNLHLAGVWLQKG